MHRIVLRAKARQKFILHPVGKRDETRVKHLLNGIHVALRYTHLAKLHLSVRHLIHHVDVKQVALRERVVRALASVHKRYFTGRHIAQHRGYVAPMRHAQHFLGFRIKRLNGIAVTTQLLFAALVAATHKLLVQISLAMHVLAAKHAHKLLKRGRGLKQETNQR